MNEKDWLLEEKYHGKECPEFFTDIKRLKKDEPIAYIIGNIPFINSEIYLDSHPLIPRTETEFWVEKIIKKINTTQPIKILDLCAGSGCIGIALLKNISSCIVDFAEIETKHHLTIQKNITINKIKEERTFITGGNLFENIKNKYDYIFTNPPYINKSLERTDKNVDTHEPHIALYAEDNGLKIIKKIIKKALVYLTETGVMYIEHEPEQTSAIHEAGKETGFSCTTFVDQYKVERYTQFIRTNVDTMAK